MSKEHLSKCQECGASIYPEHLDTGIARYEAGKLMCVHCVEEYEAAHDAVGGQVEADEPMELVEESEESAMGSRVHHFTEATIGAARPAPGCEAAWPPARTWPRVNACGTCRTHRL